MNVNGSVSNYGVNTTASSAVPSEFSKVQSTTPHNGSCTGRSLSDQVKTCCADPTIYDIAGDVNLAVSIVKVPQSNTVTTKD